jgi:hypothetical protein
LRASQEGIIDDIDFICPIGDGFWTAVAQLTSKYGRRQLLA